MHEEITTELKHLISRQDAARNCDDLLTLVKNCAKAFDLDVSFSVSSYGRGCVDMVYEVQDVAEATQVLRWLAKCGYHHDGEVDDYAAGSQRTWKLHHIVTGDHKRTRDWEAPVLELAVVMAGEQCKFVQVGTKLEPAKEVPIMELQCTRHGEAVAI